MPTTEIARWLGREALMVNDQEFCDAFADAVAAAPGSIKGHEQLADIRTWDSMAMVGVMAMADEKFGVMLSGEDLQKCKSVEDVWRLVVHRPL